MKATLLLGLLLVLPCHAGREKIGNDKYSLEFPADWKKPSGDAGSVLIVRENPTGAAMFAVSRMAVAAGGKADLTATAKTVTAGYKKDMGLKEDPKIEPGEVDGLEARFVVISNPTPPKKDGAEVPATAVYLVFVDAKTEVLILQATLTLPAEKKTSEACLAIIQSFKRE